MYLNTHSWFSLKYGTLSPDGLAEMAAAKGIKSLALTDINNTSCAFSFVAACKRRGIQALLGIEFRCADGHFLYVGIARSLEGWSGLCRLLGEASIAGRDPESVAPEVAGAFFIYRHLPRDIRFFRGDEYIGVRPDELSALYSSPLRHHRDRLVAWMPITFVDESGWKLHKLLRCIDRNTVLGRLESKDCAWEGERPESPERAHELYVMYPDLLERAATLADSCSVELKADWSNNRKTFTGQESDDHDLLRKLAYSGCRQRYGSDNEKAFQRLRSELEVIIRLGYCPYFLITWDIIRYAHSAGYFHVGRGSGANSIVAYCLRITDVDPLELDLYFERFINPHRSSPPDFDIDFSWDERDDVTEYIFNRYGKDYTALLATYNTFKGKSIIRELGKVFGLPKADIDTIVDEPLATDKHHPYATHIFRYGKMMEGFPNYLSIHAGGILISERPIYEHTALKQMPKGFPITHFDMYGAEDLHFHKYDVLSQRGLGHIKSAIDLVARNQGRLIDVHNVYKIKKDPEVRSRLKAGRCIGCFYIESPAMRGLLSKLACEDYVHLVAASSIIRPGVAKSGMMREYIQRFHHPEQVAYLHPVFEKHLSETFGVMVYQEDVMKIVHHFAGLGLDESDVLRRIMTGKKKNSDTFYQLREKFFNNCRDRGYPEELVDEVWRQIESFSGYSFCKAHSASFAVESFQSLFLKTYYPIEFMVAVINNFGGFYSTELYVHEARMSGAVIHAPCVNKSDNLTTVYGRDVYMGLGLLRDLEHKLIRRIVTERNRNGSFRSLGDFVHRIDIDSHQLDTLIRINAFRFTGVSKYELMWEKNAVFNPSVTMDTTTSCLFEPEYENYALPRLHEGRYDQTFDELELLGFPLCSPFTLLAESPPRHIAAVDMERRCNRRVAMMGYYVTRKPVRTVKGTLMYFYTWVDEQGDFFDSVHFPPTVARSPFRGGGVYLLRGKITEDFGFFSLEATEMEKIPWVKDERY